MKRMRAAAILLLLSLTACARTEQPPPLPAPAQLYEQLCQQVELPEMVDVAGELLLANTGIDPEECVEAVYYVLAQDIAPDEIILLQAPDEDSARSMYTALEEWLDYRVEAARMYLTEDMPLLQAGVVRRDGTSVSLVVSPQVEEILQVFEQYS